MARILLVASMIAALAGSSSVVAQGGPELFVQPSPLTVQVGETFDVNLMVENVTTADGLGGYTLAMAYDPAVIHGLAITDTGFIDSAENAVLCPSTGIDNDTGNLAHFCFTLPLIPEPGPTTSAPEALVTVSFEAVGEGTSVIDIAESAVIDPQGNMLVASKTDGEVEVVRIGAEGEGEPEEPAVPSPQDAPSIGLPDSGGASSSGSSNMPLIIALVFAGLGVVAVLGTLAYFRRQSRSS